MSPFDAILRNIELQPLMLRRAAVKAAPRRFSDAPPSAFGDTGTVGSERWQEVRAEEHADHQREERARQIASGE